MSTSKRVGRSLGTMDGCLVLRIPNGQFREPVNVRVMAIFLNAQQDYFFECELCKALRWSCQGGAKQTYCRRQGP